MRGARTGTPGKDQFVGRRLLRLGCFCALGAMTLTRGQSVSWPRWARTTIPRSKVWCPAIGRGASYRVALELSGAGAGAGGSFQQFHSVRLHIKNTLDDWGSRAEMDEDFRQFL